MLSMKVKFLSDCTLIVVIEFKKCFAHYFTKCLRDGEACFILQHPTHSLSKCLMLDDVIVAPNVTRTSLLWSIRKIISSQENTKIKYSKILLIWLGRTTHAEIQNILDIQTAPILTYVLKGNFLLLLIYLGCTTNHLGISICWFKVIMVLACFLESSYLKKLGE